MQQPRVTVIIPTRNRSAQVSAAICSVLAQTYPAAEVLVCDDGSTDGTRAVVAAFGAPVRLIELPYTGLPGRVRSAGVRQAVGELVAFLDDDDEWEPGKLALQVAALEAAPDAGLVYTDARLRHEDGSLSPPVLLARHARSGPLMDRLIDECFIHPSTVLVRRELLTAAGGFDEGIPIGEDYDLWLRLARLTNGVCVARPLVTVDRSAHSSSQARQRLAYEMAMRGLQRAVAGGALTWRQRLRARRSLARLGTRAGRHALSDGDTDAAVHHARGALRRYPLHREAWALLRRTLGHGTRPPHQPAAADTVSAAATTDPTRNSVQLPRRSTGSRPGPPASQR